MTCREGGCETTVLEGSDFNFGGFDSQAMMITCSSTCTCKLEDGSGCENASSITGDETSGSSILAVGFPALLATVGFTVGIHFE